MSQVANFVSPISVAPMIDRTDRHCRYFLRLIGPRVRLFTEMITAAAIVRGDAARLLAFNSAEHPVALQIAGSDPELLAAAARAGTEFGYDEINFNLGCPSSRVQTGRFGACLMRDPELVQECMAAIVASTDTPVSAKIRLGIDELDSEDFLHDFAGRLIAAGCREIFVHSRKAILLGLSPSENRNIPPLRYDAVYRLKAIFPGVRIHLNGGVRTLEDIRHHLHHVDGVMLGRKAYEDPYFLAVADAAFAGPGVSLQRSRREIVEMMVEYAERELPSGTRLHQIARHMFGLFHGTPGARRWRRLLSEQTSRADAQPAWLRAAGSWESDASRPGKERVA